MTTPATNYGHQALSAIEAYIVSLERENAMLRAQLEAMDERYSELITELECKSALGEIE